MIRTAFILSAAALLLTLLSGCLQIPSPPKELTPEQQRIASRFFANQPPTPDFPITAVFDEKIELLGLDIQGRLIPGEQIRFIWYWRALDDIHRDWKIFVHLDSLESPTRQNLDHFPLEDVLHGAFRTHHLKKGEIIADLQQFTLREDFPVGEARLYVGLFQGTHRAPLANPASADDEGRLPGPDLIILKEAPPSVRSLPVELRQGVRRSIQRRVDLQPQP